MAVSIFDLEPVQMGQLRLFDDDQAKMQRVSDAMDEINVKYGSFVITPATMLGMDGTIMDRISFGGIRDIEQAYEPENALEVKDWGS